MHFILHTTVILCLNKEPLKEHLLVGFAFHLGRQTLNSCNPLGRQPPVCPTLDLLTRPSVTQIKPVNLYNRKEGQQRRGPHQSYSGLRRVLHLRSFKVFRRYRGSPFQLSYSWVGVKDKFIHSFK